jgi:hypothetical protein
MEKKMNKLEITNYKVIFANKDLERGTRVKDGLTEVTNKIAEKIISSTYDSRKSGILHLFYDPYLEMKTFLVKFEEFNEKGITWQITSEVVNDDLHSNKLAAILSRARSINEFIFIDVGGKNHDKVILLSPKERNENLKSAVEAAEKIINHDRTPYTNPLFS